LGAQWAARCHLRSTHPRHGSKVNRIQKGFLQLVKPEVAIELTELSPFLERFEQKLRRKLLKK